MARADVKGPARANLRWSYRIGPSDTDLVDYGGVVSSPVVAADGTIYVGTRGTGSVASGLLALAPDGTLKWHYDTGANGVSSGAAVRADGSVVFASDDGTLFALETSGQRRWSTSLKARAFASPLVGPDGTIYMGTESGLTAVRSDGSIAWSNPGCAVGDGGASLQPDGSIRYTCQSALMVVSPSGVPGSGTLSATGDHQKIYGPPTIGPNGEVWFTALSVPGAATTFSATLYSYSQVAGFQKRDFNWAATAFFNGPALLPNGDAVTGAPYGVNGAQMEFVSVPIAGGFSQWATYAQGTEAQPSVDVDGNVYFTAGNTLVSLGPTGAPRWTASVDSTVLIGMAVGADGTIYAGTVNGWLYAYGP
jgi:outer membrane protein assembly factor BamB